MIIEEKYEEMLLAAHKIVISETVRITVDSSVDLRQYASLQIASREAGRHAIEFSLRGKSYFLQVTSINLVGDQIIATPFFVNHRGESTWVSDEGSDEDKLIGSLRLQDDSSFFVKISFNI